ncbi:MAG TPA: hypothetical protein GXZ31_05170 [Thermoanaerobacterales bacterium]|nr:hypothetical protein [Thermoanaerobacterales bacterium]
MLPLFLLLLWPILIFIIFNLFLLPFRFTLKSVFDLITIPFEIIRIALNKRLRQNHALEHATINVIQEYYGENHLLSGLAKENGFYVKGPVNPAVIEQAARIGLNRLIAGDSYLAIHERCGTSIAAANFIFSLIFMILLIRFGFFNILNILLAMIFANMIGPFFGKFMQKYLTTTTDVADVEIVGVEYSYPQHIGFFLVNAVSVECFVKTRVF